jgi:predicted ATPase
VFFRGGRYGSDQLLRLLAAAALFIERARAARPDFAVTNAPAIAEICHRLDGLPLAIELAAARIRLFTPEALLVRLSSPLKVLTVGARDLPARQQTLRNTIDWSYNLLDEGERMMFARLGVFVGGFTLEAAEAVCGSWESGVGSWGTDSATPTPISQLPTPILEKMEALLDKSLLKQVDRPGGGARFTILETIREYALERLAASGEETAIRRQHAAYYLALAETTEPHLRGSLQRTWFDRLEVEHNNLRASIQWAVDSKEPVIALRFGAALWRFWLMHGYLTEGRARLAALSALADVQTGVVPHIAARAQALLGLCRMANDQSDYAAARAFCEESQAIWQELGDRRGIALALDALGHVEPDEGWYEEARLTLEQSLSLYQELGDKHGIATSLDELAVVAHHQGDQILALILTEQSLALFQELGDKHGIASTLGSLGWITLAQEDYVQATKFLAQSLALYQALGDKQGISSALIGLGDLAMA